MTHRGTIGKRFGTLVVEKDDTGAAVGVGNQPPIYEVVERFQEGEEVIVKAKFLGTDESLGKA
jgi:hypothetical protein